MARKRITHAEAIKLVNALPKNQLFKLNAVMKVAEENGIDIMPNNAARFAREHCGTSVCGEYFIEHVPAPTPVPAPEPMPTPEEIANALDVLRRAGNYRVTRFDITEIL